MRALLLVVLASTASAEVLAPSDGKDVRQSKIAEGIYQFTTVRDAYVRQLNSVAIVMDRDVLVFDTNTRPSSARLVLAAIKKITDKPVRFVVNSHWHPDHWSGNEVYQAAFPALDIIATEETRKTMEVVADSWPVRFKGELAKMQAAGGDEADLKNYASFLDEQTKLRRVYPTMTYVDHMTLFHGGRELRFMSVAGDAEGTTVLYLPKEKVLITGDAVSYPIPYITPPPSRQAASLRALTRLDADVIIPGHGPAFHDKVFMSLEAELLETVVAGVRTALQQKMLTLEEIQKTVTAESLREKFTGGDADLDARYRDRVKVLVKLAIREARDGQDLPQ